MTTPTSNDQPRAELRRQEDRNLWTVIEGFAKVIANFKVIFIGGGAVIAATAAAGGWIGAQRGTPARVTRNEIRLDSSNASQDRRIGALEERTTAVEKQQDSTRIATQEALELLLRISCPSVQRSDLVRQCRPYSPSSRR
jgi:hypothetical protein